MTEQHMSIVLPMRLPPWLAGDLARLAKAEARRDGCKANLSATARRAIVAYIEAHNTQNRDPGEGAESEKR